MAKWMIEHDGPDPRFGHLTTSTGRVGHVTNLQFDALSVSYCGENKNEKLPAHLAGYWQKICSKSIEWGKNPFLRWHPSNANEWLVGGKALPELHMITKERHEELLRYEHIFKEGGT